MTTFDRREEAYEAAFAHEQDMLFRARAQSTHDLAIWAAALMGKDASEAERYADEMVRLLVNATGERSIDARIADDLRAAGSSIDEPAVRQEAATLLAATTRRLKAG